MKAVRIQNHNTEHIPSESEYISVLTRNLPRLMLNLALFSVDNTF